MRGVKARRDVVAVVWQPFLDVHRVSSPSRSWWWSLLLHVDWAGTVGLLARAVVVVAVAVAVVTGCVLGDATGRGGLGVVMGCVIVVVGAGAVPVPVTGGRLNRFNASSTLTG